MIEKLTGSAESEKRESDVHEKIEPADRNSINRETGLQFDESILPESTVSSQASILEKREPSEALQKMIDKNPSLNKLIDRFGLEEV